MMSAFLGGGYWQNQQDENRTPSELLEEIYNDLPEDEHRSYTLERFIIHQNCSLELAIKISTISDPPKNAHYYHQSFDNLRKQALMRVAEITKKQLEA